MGKKSRHDTRIERERKNTLGALKSGYYGYGMGYFNSGALWFILLGIGVGVCVVDA